MRRGDTGFLTGHVVGDYDLGDYDLSWAKHQSKNNDQCWGVEDLMGRNVDGKGGVFGGRRRRGRCADGARVVGSGVSSDLR